MNNNFTDPKDPIPAPEPVEVKFGRITFISPDKGAFVELISPTAEQISQAETELFISKDLLANFQDNSKALNIGQMVQVTKIGEKITDIKPY